MQKTLILPAEIYAREFDARLLHAIVALQQGWRVIVGSKALINRSIWRLPRGVYLCQTMTHKRVRLLKLLRTLGYAAFGWDEEGLIYLNREVYLMRRISVETLALLQAVVAWGQQGAEDVGQRAIALGLSPLPLGNPRFDLLRPELRELYQPEVEAIRQKFGRFILINTNFSSLNPIVSIHDQKPRVTSAQHPPTDAERARFAKMQAHRKDVLDAFEADLPQLAARHPERHFVLRAHPGEDETKWTTAFMGLANVSVLREGSSIPWLLAADALVHNNCTTAVEAAIIGLTPICYCPVVSLEDEAGLPNPVSHRAYSLREMDAAITLSELKMLKPSPAQVQLLNAYVSGLKGPLASETIMQHLAKLNVAPVLPSAVWGVRFFGAARELFKSLRRDHITDRYLKKVFPLVSADTVAIRANQIAQVLKMDRKVTVVERSTNIFELSLA